MKRLGDLILISICGIAILTFFTYIDSYYSTTNVEQKAK